MAGRIPIGDARKIADSRGCPLVVIFGISESGEHFHVTTYGRNKKLCKLAAEYGDMIADKVLDGTISPPQIEPEGPEEPATFTGEKRR